VSSESATHVSPLGASRLARRLCLVAWGALWLALAALAIYPVSTNATRLGALVCAATLWAGGLLLFWESSVARYALLAFALVLASLFVAPGRASDPAALRRAYVSSLTKYEGTRYVWGGESRFGIDCSGLVRRALVNADFREGLASANPKLLREAASLWWHDTSASGLLAGYNGRTRALLDAQSIDELDHARLQPGDIVVTSDGLHTMAYAGDETWIEADPNPGRVVTVRAPSNVGWFKVPVRVMRWRQFDEAVSDSH
jgi:hypothetical protein